MNNTLVQTIVALMERGADIVRIGKASESNDITVGEMQQLNHERRMAFTYESAKDELIITMEPA